jgi:hypothetical protein
MTAMSARSALIYVTVALPPLVLAAVGVTHPTHLTASTADYWRDLHIAILPIFPLLGFAPWLVARGTGTMFAWVVGVLGFVYAAFYTALDVLAGIGAGGLKVDGMGMATGTVFGLGSHIGEVGSVAFIAATAIASATAIVRFRAVAVAPSLLVLMGAVLFLQAHIYFPVGVIGQLCLALGWAWLYFVVERATRASAGLVAPVTSVSVQTD